METKEKNKTRGAPVKHCYGSTAEMFQSCKEHALSINMTRVLGHLSHCSTSLLYFIVMHVVVFGSRKISCVCTCFVLLIFLLLG